MYVLYATFYSFSFYVCSVCVCIRMGLHRYALRSLGLARGLGMDQVLFGGRICAAYSDRDAAPVCGFFFIIIFLGGVVWLGLVCFVWLAA